MKPLFTLVTGNQHKLREYRRLLPPSIVFTHSDLDLEEIQDFDAKVIVEHKLREAFRHIGSPVVVEDVSAGLTALNGLPGPFIKFFEKRLGSDALYQLVKDDARATIDCYVGYFDGQRLLIAEGHVKGSLVPMRKEIGYGFDNVFIPNGYNQTFSAMNIAQKDKISHRGLAVRELLSQLNV